MVVSPPEPSLSRLLSPLRLRGVTLRSRIVISPMSQYRARDGFANDWHLVNAGRFAMGGAGTVMVEATAVTADGRGTPGDLGLWDDRQIAPLARIADFLTAHDSVAAIQLNHAGRKASRRLPWNGGALDETDAARGSPPWPTWGPTDEPAMLGAPPPRPLDAAGLDALASAWAAAAGRAARAGFRILELHAAHGYLLHQFLSPLSNTRGDEFGGDLAGRMRFPLRVVEAVRAAWPEDRPLFVRISATDWRPEGWSVADSRVLAAELKTRGVDLVDCSSGGITRDAPPAEPGHQVHLAAAVRQAGIATMAVGHIVDPGQAEAILAAGEADLIAVGREALIHPNWALLRGEADPRDFAHWPEPAGWWLQRRQELSRP